MAASYKVVKCDSCGCVGAQNIKYAAAKCPKCGEDKLKQFGKVITIDLPTK